MTEPTFSSATVVGGHGFIGRHLVKDLERRGLEVFVPDRADVSWMDRPQGLVIWAAGYTADYGEDPAATVEAHAAAIARLVGTPRYEGLVYLSSCRLFDGHEGWVNEATPLALDPAQPRHLYDLSKGLGEWMVRHQGGPRARVARLASVYSDALDGGSFFDEVLDRALEGRGGEVATAADIARDYVHIDDVCSAIWAIATRSEHDLYIVASGELVDNETLLGVLSERTGILLEPALPPARPTLPSLDISRLVGELLVEPRCLSEGLDRVLTWQNNQRAMRSMMGITQMPWM